MSTKQKSIYYPWKTKEMIFYSNVIMEVLLRLIPKFVAVLDDAIYRFLYFLHDLIGDSLDLLPIGLKEYIVVFLLLLIFHIILFEMVNAIRRLFNLFLKSFELEDKYRLLRKKLRLFIDGRKRRAIRRDPMVKLLGRYLTSQWYEYKIIWPKRKFQGTYKYYHRKRRYQVVFPLEQKNKRLMTDMSKYAYPERGIGKNEHRKLIIFPRRRKIEIQRTILERFQHYIIKRYSMFMYIVLMLVGVILDIILPKKWVKWLKSKFDR
jgi:hypothetical protein